MTHNADSLLLGSGGVRKLAKRHVEKVWGREALPEPFVAPDGQRIGEIWFEPPPELPDILVKYLFTSEKLSVQVHPSDENALSGEAGKEECWLVLDAEPGASLAIGFNDTFGQDDIEKAALDGSIEDMLVWHEVKAGDFFYLPAGTVHAIGPGLSLVEVQQASDTTFRLYDYRRPRELHLERGLAVATGERYSLINCTRARGPWQCLTDGPFFRFDRLEGAPDTRIIEAFDCPLLVLPITGQICDVSGSVEAQGGECLVAKSIRELDFAGAEVSLLVCPV